MRLTSNITHPVASLHETGHCQEQKGHTHVWEDKNKRL